MVCRWWSDPCSVLQKEYILWNKVETVTAGFWFRWMHVTTLQYENACETQAGQRNVSLGTGWRRMPRCWRNECRADVSNSLQLVLPLQSNGHFAHIHEMQSEQWNVLSGGREGWKKSNWSKSKTVDEQKHMAGTGRQIILTLQVPARSPTWHWGMMGGQESGWYDSRTWRNDFSISATQHVCHLSPGCSHSEALGLCLHMNLLPRKIISL